MQNKAINRDAMHQEFEELLQRLQPDERLIQVFQLNLEKQIKESEKNKYLVVTSLKNNLRGVEDKIQRFIDRI
jgi:phospholipid N-methyltransferase